MPLPALNTSGIDITNTLAKISGMKTDKLRQKNLEMQNTLAAEQMTPEAKKARTEAANTIAQGAKLDLEKKKYDASRQALATAMGLASTGDETAYPTALELIKGIGQDTSNFADPNAFYTEKEDQSSPGGMIKKYDTEAAMNYIGHTIKTADQVVAAGVKAKGSHKLVNVITPNGTVIKVGVDKAIGIDPVKAFGPGYKLQDTTKVKDKSLTEFQESTIASKAAAATAKAEQTKVTNLAKAEKVEAEKKERVTELYNEIFDVDSKTNVSLEGDKIGAAGRVKEFNAKSSDSKLVWRESKAKVDTAMSKVLPGSTTEDTSQYILINKADIPEAAVEAFNDTPDELKKKRRKEFKEYYGFLPEDL